MWCYLLLCIAYASSDQFSQNYSNVYSGAENNITSVLLHAHDYEQQPGYFSMSYEFAISKVSTLSDDILNRTMLHFMVCTESEMMEARFYDNGFCSSGGFQDQRYCDVIDIPNTHGKDGVWDGKGYYANSYLSYFVSDAVKERLYFLLVSCETLGGEYALLKSCKHEQYEEPCFICKRNTYDFDTSNCTVPRSIPHVLQWNVGYDACTLNGNCIGGTHAKMLMLMLGFVGIWILLSAAWAYNVLTEKDSAFDLQLKMTWLPFAKLAYLGVKTIMYYCQTKGISDATIKFVYYGESLAFGYEKMMSAYLMLMIAAGWKITQFQLKCRTRRKIVAISVVWGMTWLMFLLDPVTARNGNSLVSTMLVVIWMCIVFDVWGKTNINIQVLSRQMEMISEANIDPETTPVFTKIRLFTYFRSIYLAYLLATMSAVVVPPIPGIHSYRVYNEILDIFLYAGLGYTFRCRKFSYIFHVTYAEEPQPPPKMYIAKPETSDHLTPWNDSMPLPTVQHTRSSKKSNVVVVLNPDSERVIGNALNKTEIQQSPTNDNAREPSRPCTD